VYAIEPCKNKCKFIELMAKLNILGNVVVINVGLANIQHRYTKNTNNSFGGGTTWSESNNLSNDYI